MLRSLLTVLIAVGMASPALAVDRKYFEIQEVQISDITEQVETAPAYNTYGLQQNCGGSAGLQYMPRFSGDIALAELDPLTFVEVVVDRVINLGKKVFAVIEAGRPVVNVKLDNANALPQGLTCWSDLSGWQIPQSKVYNVRYVNGFGMTVVDYSYRVTYTAGGSLDGIGKYITHATFQPANVSIAWGFEFNATAAVPSVFNTGTRQDPIAGMQMNMEWKVNSPVSHEQRTETFFISGENNLVKMD